jgi:hypothetical protein
MDKTEKSILFIFVILLIVACCFLALCGGIYTIARKIIGLSSTDIAATAPVIDPTKIMLTPMPTWIVDTGQAFDTLETLQTTIIPSADLVYLAERYEGKKGISLQLTTPPVIYQVGDKLDFYKLNVDTNTTDQITAVLRYATDTIYFWAEEDLDLSQNELDEVMAVFEDEIYPINQEFFGKEWIPGVDNDPHLYILYASDLGTHLAGYTASSDEVLTEAHEYSNAHEMFYINSDVQRLSDPYTLSVMAHELQHLIHGYHDGNEELWLNEGFSELATLLNGYDAGGFDSLFSYNTDVQLNDWSTDADENDVHYGASFLYVTYLLDRFGEDITKDIVADPLDGFGSIDHVLLKNGLTDPETGKPISADDFFADWAITNYLNDSSYDDGRYYYSIYPSAPAAAPTETITFCDGVQLDRSVHQYGADYIELACDSEEIQLHFSGSSSVPVLPVSTGTNKFMWSNRADSSATKLTREFDFTDVSGPITLTYNTWYDLEADYDYLYLIATENGGDGQIILTPSCTGLDLTGNSYGCGYNGSSNGWITEEVDLTQFAGKSITLSFEYITDEAVTAEGFIVDDIRIPSIAYKTDFENDDGGWNSEGFVRIENAIPQSFLVSIIDSSGETPVQKYTLGSGEELSLTLKALPQGDEYVLVVSGSSRYTRQEALYQVILIQK